MKWGRQRLRQRRGLWPGFSAWKCVYALALFLCLANLSANTAHAKDSDDKQYHDPHVSPVSAAHLLSLCVFGLTIGSLAYQISADSQKFTAGIVASKSELRTLKDAFLASQSPTERYSSAIEHLENLAQKFPDKAGAIAKTIAKMREEMNPAVPSQWHQVFEKIHHLLGNVQLTFDPISAGFKVLHFGIDKFKEIVGEATGKMRELSALSKKSELLGVTMESLSGLAAAAGRISGVDFGTFEAGFIQFTRRVAEAAMDAESESGKAFERIGLDAQELSTLSADEQFLRTAEAIQKVENAGERLSLGKSLLGRGGVEMASTLAAGRERIEELSAEAVKLQQLDFIDIKAIRQATGAMTELKHGIEGVWNVAASEFAPIVTEIKTEFLEFLEGASGKGEEFRGMLHGLATATQSWLDGLVAVGNAPIWKWLVENSGIVRDIITPLATVPNRGMIEGPTGKYAEFQHGLADKPSPSQVESLKARETALSEFDKTMDRMIAEDDRAEAKINKDKIDTANRVMEIQGRAYEDAERRSEAIANSQRNNAEKLQDDLRELVDLNEKGFFDLHPGAFERGLEDLRDKASEMAGGGDHFKGITSAVSSASAEGIAARFGTKDDRAAKDAAKAQKQRDDANKLLQEIRDNQPVLGRV